MIVPKIDKKIIKKYSIVAGADECGVACLSGPLVACCAIFDDRILSEEAKYIIDCKRVSSYNRLKSLSKKIKKMCIAYGISAVPPKRVTHFTSDSKKALCLSIRKAIQRSNKRVPIVIVDHYKVKVGKSTEIKALNKADDKVRAVAGASIIAKAFRDSLMRRMHKKYPQYKWNKNYGGYTREHREAIRDVGITPIHRPYYCDLYLENYGTWVKEEDEE